MPRFVHRSRKNQGESQEIAAVFRIVIKKFLGEEQSSGALARDEVLCSCLMQEWVPPVGQTGDGRTSLNSKLGY